MTSYGRGVKRKRGSEEAVRREVQDESVGHGSRMD